MAKIKIDRRDLLKSAALSALILPVVRGTMTSRAQAQSSPIKRFMVLWHPNGLEHVSAGPNGGERDFSFGEYFEGLERHRQHTIALSGMHIGGVPYGANSEVGHKSGGIGCLTCTPDERTGYATGPSVDQFIAQKLAEQNLAPALRAPVFGVGNNKQYQFAPVFHEAAGKPVVIENEPRIAFEAMFGDVAASMGEDVGALIARKKSILDTALEDCNSHLPALPSAGRELLDYHCTRIRELEMNLQNTAFLTCDPPQRSLDAVADHNPGDPNDYPNLTDFFFDLMQVTFLCDLTRVQSFSFGDDASRLNMPWVNPPLLASVNTGESNVRDHHSHTHAGTRETVGLFMKWYTEKFAQLLDRFTEPLPDGSRLLDSTVMYWTTEYGGAAHSNRDVAGFVFGDGQGLFGTGRHLHHDNDARHSHALMVSLIQYMGITGVEQFGHPGGGSGPLDSLYA